MKVFMTLWAVCLVGLSYCGDNEKRRRAGNGDHVGYESSSGDELYHDDIIFKSTQPIAVPESTSLCSLDISNPDETKILTRVTYNNGFSYKEFTAKEDFNIISVLDKSQILWVSGGRRLKHASCYEAKDSSLISIYFTNVRKVESECFEKVHGEWREIEDKAFEVKACKITRGECPTVSNNGKSSESVASEGADDDTMEGDDDPYFTLPGNLDRRKGKPPFAIRSPQTIDISSPNASIYRSFDYLFAGNQTRLIVPKRGIFISRLVNGNEEIWTPEKGGVLDYLKIYLDKYKRPVIALVIMGISGCTLQRYYERNNGKWEESKWCYDEKINSLKINIETRGNIIMDIENQKDTNDCRIFEAELFGVPTRHFFPRLGYEAKEVRYGEQTLWKAASCGEQCASCGYQDHCLAIKIYRKRTLRLLEITIAETRARAYKHFKKVKKGWKPITLEEFFRKLTDVRAEYIRVSSD
ncbi:signal peptide containing protein [Theileria equi strain WA]|uniref:Signal peptide containing protein n=1 Tax=Theileria equi strain WA TaxID=1537102 RepID=L1LA83_THEEQ|nr:signal peptide containing protein [Theileria equi strain WA]EKX72357.1 signal peptide containing protein [Theileria equi strain WA]|eukprot:XP_004831809.1 signal peptide containing protein [Theileria equi strain WA]